MRILTGLSSIRLNKQMLVTIFAFAFLFICCTSIISYLEEIKLRKANNWVFHTYQVIGAIDASLYTIVDIESRQRAYLVTRKSKYIEDIDALKSQLKLNLTELATLTKDNPKQSERVAKFIDIVKYRLDVLNRVVQFKVDNKIESPEATELFALSQELSGDVKSQGQEIKSVELVLLNERNNNALKSSDTTNTVLIIGNLTSILVLGLAFLLSINELSYRLSEQRTRMTMETRFRSIIENSHDMIAAVNKNSEYIIFNEPYQHQFHKLFGKHITVGMTLNEALSEAGEDRKQVLELWKESLAGNEYIKTIDFDINNEKGVFEVTSNFIKEEDQIIGAVHIVRNVTERMKEQTELQIAYDKLNEGMQALQEKNIKITVLVEMSDIMLACHSQEELSDVMKKYCGRLLNFASGHLNVMHPSKNYLEVAASWGTPATSEATFFPDQCWGIRLGRVHNVDSSHHQLICNHINVSPQDQTAFICVPLMAQNDIYGLLYLEVPEENQAIAFSEDQRLFITAFAELTALALANVRLRENLRYQSIRDPLTGLYNRRYLEDFLFKQIHQSERTHAPISLLMMDLDHFKRVNDNFGHEAGDIVLKELGRILQIDIRLGDLASRYGGEEFIVVFYDADTEVAMARAEQIRVAVSMLQVRYGAQEVGPITVSIGIAQYPNDGKQPNELIEAADKALYHAKNTGRNKIVLFESLKTHHSL